MKWWRRKTRTEETEKPRPKIWAPGEPVRGGDFRDTGQDTGRLGFSPDESIRLDSEADMMSVRTLIHVLQDEPDKARSVVRTLSRPEVGLLLFYAGELSRIVSEEDMFRTDADRRTARRTFERTDADSR